MTDKITIEKQKDRYIIHIKDDYNYRDFSFPISKKQFLELYNKMDIEIKKEMSRILGVEF
jgi:hypothetical protein